MRVHSKLAGVSVQERMAHPSSNGNVRAIQKVRAANIWKQCIRRGFPKIFFFIRMLK